MNLKLLLTLFAALPALFPAACAGGKITLVKDGKPNAVIILGDRPTRSARLAACELQHAVERMTGARLSIASRMEAGRPRIFIGPSAEAAQLGFPGKPFSGEEYLVGRKGEDIFLMGKDEPDFGKFDYGDIKTFPALIFYYRSTTYAVYDFLEQSCGVRFYSFGDRGTVHPRTENLSVIPRETRRMPAMNAFRRPYFSNRTRDYRISDRDAMLLQFRWRSNAMFGVTNHSVYSIYYRYWDRALPRKLASLFIERRPEYFARNYNSTLRSSLWRQFPENSNPPPQLCTSHPGPVEYFAECAEKSFAGKAIVGNVGVEVRKMEDQPFYYPIQEDDNSVWCQCPDCRKHAYKNLHFEWVNRIARRAARKNPAVGISTLAYSSSAAYPENVRLEKNIAVQMCFSIQSWFHPRVYSLQHGYYKEWVRREGGNRPLFLWLYLLCPSHEAKRIYGYRKFFPVVYPWKAGQYAREFANDGICGWFGEIDPGPHLLEAYVITRISDDSSLDPEQLIDEYFKLYYGHAGAAMKEFYRTLENIGWNIRNYSDAVRTASPRWSFVYGLHRERDNWHLGTAERVNRLEAIVRKAERAAVSPEEKARIQFFRETLWDQAVQGRKEYEERERIRKILIPFTTPDYAGECAGDLSRVDFARAARLAPFVTLDNRKTEVSPSLLLSSDSTHLYFRFEEKGDEAFRHRQKSVWNNALEIFLASRRESDYLQLVYSPTGKVRAFTSLTVEGVRRFSEIPVSLTTENTCDGNGWSLKGAIPLSRIPSGVKVGWDGQIVGNFFRTRRYEGGVSLAWSPIFASDYKSGLYRMGSIQLPGPSFSGVIFQKPFTMKKQQNAPDGWTRNHLKDMDQKTPLEVRSGTLALVRNPEKPLHLYYTERGYIPANRGDKLIFEFQAKGTSRIEVGAYFYHGRGGGALLLMKPQYLSGEEKRFTVVLEIVNRSKIRPVTSLRPILVFPPGMNASIRNLKITLVPRSSFPAAAVNHSGEKIQ